EPADIVAHDEQYVGLLRVLRDGRPVRQAEQADYGQHPRHMPVPHTPLLGLFFQFQDCSVLSIVRISVSNSADTCRYSMIRCILTAWSGSSLARTWSASR